MGFLDSFFTAAGSFLTSPIGTAIGQIGVAKLIDVIGLTPTGPSGSPRSGMAPFSPLGTPRMAAPFLTSQQLAEQARRAAEEAVFFGGGRAGVESPQLPQLRPALGPQVFRPGFAAPLPTIPSSQPFGVAPGTGLAPLPPGGFSMAAFPTAVNASFPSSPFTTGNPFLQQAGFLAPLAGIGGALARQIPGALAGALGGALVGGGGGDGGPGTPPFRATMAGARAQFFRTPNPATGQDTWFRPAGRPLLWSGDLTACKRVNKIARRAKRKR